MKPVTHNQPEYTVSEISNAVKGVVENAFGYVRIRGEISGLKVAGTGHHYFSLKDADSVLNAICWKGVANSLLIKPEEGLEVIATGKMTTYKGQSRYQLIVDSIEMAGVGALLKQLEERKKQLAAEGLFNPEHKKSLPFLPRTIGIITSSTGAVIDDMINQFRNRCGVHIMLYPVRVQGDTAKQKISKAIYNFNSLQKKPDVLIVARGGGSLEDLWAFNEEIVVRAVAESAIPVISGVGHEPDVTLIDFVADVRASTPTDAAKRAVPVKAELQQLLHERQGQLMQAMQRLLREKIATTKTIAMALRSPQQIWQDATQNLDNWQERLQQAMQNALQQATQKVNACLLRSPQEQLVHKKQLVAQHAQTLLHSANAMLGRKQQQLLKQQLVPPTLALNAAQSQLQQSARMGDMLNQKHATLHEQLTHYERLLESYSYRNILQRGFVLVQDKNGKPVLNAKTAEKQQDLTLQFSDDAVKVSTTKQSSLF